MEESEREMTDLETILQDFVGDPEDIVFQCEICDQILTFETLQQHSEKHPRIADEQHVDINNVDVDRVVDTGQNEEPVEYITVITLSSDEEDNCVELKNLNKVNSRRHEVFANDSRQDELVENPGEKNCLSPGEIIQIMDKSSAEHQQQQQCAVSETIPENRDKSQCLDSSSGNSISKTNQKYIRVVKRLRFRCKFCHDTFVILTDALEHEVKYHKLRANQTGRFCNLCGRRYIRDFDLKRHIEKYHVKQQKVISTK